MKNNPILLIGFKNVGKSVIGKALAEQLQQPFVDLDLATEELFLTNYKEKLTCRQIMQTRGQAFFREIEHQALVSIIGLESSIISLGGGTPLEEKNQELIKSYRIIHVTAPRGIVFERIMVNGRPAFFLNNEDLFASFNQIWEEREKVYQKLASFSVDNNSSVIVAVEQILKQLNSMVNSI